MIACGFFASEDDLRFRPMTTADMDEIMVIERTSYRFPWSMGFFLQELQVACARSILPRQTAGSSGIPLLASSRCC